MFKEKTDAHRNVRTSACHFGDQTEVRHTPIQEIPPHPFLRPVETVEFGKQQWEIHSKALLEPVDRMVTIVGAHHAVDPVAQLLHLNLEELPPPEYR